MADKICAYCGAGKRDLTRSEQVSFKLKVNYEAFQVYQKQLIEMDPSIKDIPLTSTDTLNVTYTIYLDYMAKVVRNLELICMMADDDSILQAAHKEANYGRSLLVEMISKLDRISQKQKQG